MAIVPANSAKGRREHMTTPNRLISALPAIIRRAGKDYPRRFVALALLLLASFGFAGGVSTARAEPDRLTCAGYPEPRIFLEGQAWWIRTPGRNGHDFGHIHIGTCFPQAATLSGRLEADLRLILHNNPGVVDEIVVKVRNDDDNYTDLYRQVNNGWACLGTCERWEHVTLDTRRLPTDGIKEFIFEVFVDEPDGKSLLGAVVFRNRVANGKVVNPHFTDYAARGVARYKEFGYSYSRFLSNLPSQPVRGVYAFEVQLNNRPSPAEAAGLSYDVLLDANFHAGIMGTVLKEGKGNFTGQLTLDTTRLENGPHRLLLRMHSNDGSAGSTLSSVLVIPFTVDNPGGDPTNPPSTPAAAHQDSGQRVRLSLPRGGPVHDPHLPHPARHHALQRQEVGRGQMPHAHSHTQPYAVGHQDLGPPDRHSDANTDGHLRAGRDGRAAQRHTAPAYLYAGRRGAALSGPHHLGDVPGRRPRPLHRSRARWERVPHLAPSDGAGGSE
jgi:hypothetical protein